MSSAIIGDGSVSNGRQGSSLFLTPTIFGGKPPLSPSSLKNKCHGHSDGGKRSGSNKCHSVEE
ncbi:WRKY transcription factor, partial [Trifolium medium]|nr:WRKY transcription factor [Trifolium medium]